ncbi:CPBP family intramembrane glutamic endopeptidase [Halalkalibacillus halophilus]|uniref:CPBP family intramembrane glutamic endopeptidase n=1 Tax=Halalkalibacillus halophilus TaxID=392827 RepID=UPI00040C904E|nr:CPBP family intramembrane glutamic endopeptidase [Halalkalibacillus halophilus]
MPKRYWGILIVYLAAQLSGVIGVPILREFYPNESIENLFVYWTLGSMTVGFLWIMFLLKKDMQQVNMRSGPSFGKIIGWSVLGVFLAYFVQIIANIINIYVLGIDQGSENTADIMGLIEENILFILLPILFAPVLEEIIFRKIIFGEIYKKTNFIIAGLASSLIFAAVHWDFTFILTYTAMGFAFAYLYVKTNRIIVPIIAHMAMNTIVILIQMNLDIDELERQLEEMSSIVLLYLGGK